MSGEQLPLALDGVVEQAIMWSIFADLVRRHPKELDLWMDYYPSGAQMLSASRTGHSRTVSLNTHGGSLWVTDGDRHYSLEQSIWRLALEQGMRKTTPVLEDALGLRQREKAEPATGPTLVPRVIAAFLRHHAFTHFTWHVTAIHQRDEVNPNDIVIGKFFEAGPIDELRTPFPLLLWRIRDHQDLTTAAITPAGRAVSKAGVVLDLLEVYQRSGRKLGPVVDAVFGIY